MKIKFEQKYKGISNSNPDHDKADTENKRTHDRMNTIQFAPDALHYAPILIVAFLSEPHS